MKKTIYEAPEALIVVLDNVDVITASVFTDNDMIADGWISA